MGIIKAFKLGFDYLKYDEDGNVEATPVSYTHLFRNNRENHKKTLVFLIWLCYTSTMTVIIGGNPAL